MSKEGIEGATQKGVGAMKQTVGKAVGNERLEIRNILGGKSCARAECHGCNHAIDQATAAATGSVEPIGRDR